MCARSFCTVVYLSGRKENDLGRSVDEGREEGTMHGQSYKLVLKVSGGGRVGGWGWGGCTASIAFIVARAGNVLATI